MKPRKKHPRRPRKKHPKYPESISGNRVGQFRRDHQPTAVGAAFAIKDVTGPQRTLVYETLLAYPEGLIDQEIIAITGIRQQSENPRRGELVTSGHVIDSGETRMTECGRPAIVWKVVK